MTVHRFEVERMPPNEWGPRMALIQVDGRPLLDIIREIELPIAADAGQPELAGSYYYLNATDVLPPSCQLLHRENWRYPPNWRLVFDRRPYQRAMETPG
jgi:hypothetical protein